MRFFRQPASLLERMLRKLRNPCYASRANPGATRKSLTGTGESLCVRVQEVLGTVLEPGGPLCSCRVVPVAPSAASDGAGRAL